MDGPRECVLSYGLIAHQGSLGRDWLCASEDAVRVDKIIDFSGLGDFIDMPFRTYFIGHAVTFSFCRILFDSAGDSGLG
jgi:hypothetical protein